MTLEGTRDVAEVISSGSWFHVWGPETENARLPIVDSLTAGTVRRLVTAEVISPQQRRDRLDGADFVPWNSTFNHTIFIGFNWLRHRTHSRSNSVKLWRRPMFYVDICWENLPQSDVEFPSHPLLFPAVKTITFDFPSVILDSHNKKHHTASSNKQ